jgi:hypothetical protein
VRSGRAFGLPLQLGRLLDAAQVRHGAVAVAEQPRAQADTKETANKSKSNTPKRASDLTAGRGAPGQAGLGLGYVILGVKRLYELDALIAAAESLAERRGLHPMPLAPAAG